MRKCDNCNYGSYGLDCNTGIDTLYCTENGYDTEVDPEDVCQSHQFIAGMEDEKNYILYDEEYLGPGFLIVTKENNKVVRFLKLYTTNAAGFPSYSLRAFAVGAKDNPESEFNTINFTFRNMEDDKNGLFQAFTCLCFNLNHKKVSTINKLDQGRNHFKLDTNGNVTTLSVSKDIYGVKHATDFIDIVIGDNYTCENYDAISSFYNELSSMELQTAKEEDIKQIIHAKI